MKKERILVIDDTDLMRNILSDFFEDLGHEVSTADDTVKAKAWLSSNTPDFVTVDIMMPDGNGVDFCRWFRSQEKFQRTPLLACSGVPDEETAQDALRAGADDFLRKPFSLEDLKAKFEGVLNRRRQSFPLP
jgi:DNA-binding response OmpR family regulator